MHKINLNSNVWTVTNERHNASPLLGFLPLFCSMTTDIERFLDGELNLEFLVEFSFQHVRMAAVASNWEKAGWLTVQKLDSTEFVDRIITGLSSETINLNRLGDFLRSTNFRDFADEDIAKKVSIIVDSLSRFIFFNNIINTSDFYHEIFTRKILESLQISLGSESAITAETVYSVLTTPKKTVWIQEEEVGLLEILTLVYQDSHLVFLAHDGKLDDFFNGVSVMFGSELEAHAQKYFWIRYEQEGEILTGKYFCDELAKMICDGVDATAALHSVNERRVRTKDQFNLISSSVTLNPEAKHLLDVARKFIYWKLHLREVKIRFYCCANNILDEAAKRLGLNRYQIRHLMVDELIGALRGTVQLDAHCLDKRIEYCVFYFTSGRTTVYEGQNAREIFSIVNQDIPLATDKVSGVCAFPGLVDGVVKQVLDVNDGDNFSQGNVLVAYMTDVGVVSAMKKASAIVTDVGGVTCHASIIAREFGIPCLIGTKIATKILLNGYTVQVNATDGFSIVLSKKISSPEGASDLPKNEDLTIHDFQIPMVKSTRKETKHICSLERIFSDDVQIAGGKGASLGHLLQLGLPVPKGFVILTSVFEEVFFGTKYGKHINQLLLKICDQRSLRRVSKAIQQLIVNMEIPSYIECDIRDFFSDMPYDYVAVRSSAISEDSATASWAGQLDSFLNTTHSNLLLNIRRCWASLFSDRAISYRVHCGLSSSDIVTAVLVQGMLDSRVSGTAFSAHPVTGQSDSILIESCIGLGETLVLGREMPTTFLVKKDGLDISYKDVGHQINGLRRSSNGKGNELFLVDSTMQPLSDVESQEIARLVIDVERKFGFPVDVEWAYEEDRLYLLQSRPITALRHDLRSGYSG
ncbi:MAG: PEP/pyruvate-binding domain-containing protein [Candidatus Accumulibacter sp. UW20]|jgi:phosphohistidine swiveling domain-containing protein